MSDENPDTNRMRRAKDRVENGDDAQRPELPGSFGEPRILEGARLGVASSNQHIPATLKRSESTSDESRQQASSPDLDDCECIVPEVAVDSDTVGSALVQIVSCETCGHIFASRVDEEGVSP